MALFAARYVDNADGTVTDAYHWVDLDALLVRQDLDWNRLQRCRKYLFVGTGGVTHL